MSNIDVRYIINEGSSYGSGFIIWDQKEKRAICACGNRKDAGMIAGLLNAKEAKQDKEEYEKQVEGVRKEIGGI